MQFNDDDIQFLGGIAPQPTIRKGEDMTPSLANKKKFFSWQRAALAVIILLLLAICAWLGWGYYQHHRWAVNFEYPVSRSSVQIITDLNKTGQIKGDSVHVFTADSIDGVTMRFYNLAGLKASMSREMPADSDSSVVLVTQGWDYYFDDAKQYHFLGDFVYNGKMLAQGTGKAGFVAVTTKGWQMGISQEDSVRDYVLDQGGSMFRQFALVSAGQICLKQFALKGKVHRRALARKPGDATAYYVETVNKESLYDFAEALADYGFIDAVYLTGADGTEPVYRDADGILHGDLNVWTRKSNLLVFRK
uniref:hypothetical protein n=1 Tax=Prevotella sp. TaxID=59823 RepID=UPI004026D298